MTRGEEFREAFGKTYDLSAADPSWSAMLEQVTATLDLIERLEENVADQPLTVAGSTGQQRANPLLGELRQQRAALSRLLVALGTDEPESFQQRQTRYARNRWKT